MGIFFRVRSGNDIEGHVHCVIFLKGKSLKGM
jgi:hypothetical protein